MPLAALAIVAVLALLPTACGDDPQPEIEAVFDRAATAFADRDARTLCRLLSPRGKLLVGSSGHEERPLNCRQDVRRFIDATLPYRAGPRPEIVDVAETDDGRASAHVRLPSGATVTLPFTESSGGDWQLDGFFDASLSLLQAVNYPEANRLTVAPDPAPPDADNVTVRDGRTSRRPCPNVIMDANEYPLVSGGCVLEVKAEAIGMSVWGPFGVLPYGDCEVSYALHVDSAGRAWLTDFLVMGRNPCVDTVACYDRDKQNIPWAATITRTGDDRLRIRLDDICLDTCMGRFRGRWDMELVQQPQGTTVRFASTLGSTGWTSRGAVTSANQPLRVDRD